MVEIKVYISWVKQTVTAANVCDPVTGKYWVYLNTQNMQKAEKAIL